MILNVPPHRVDLGSKDRIALAGLPQPNWLASPHTAMLSVILADAWSGIPVMAISLQAELLTLPKDPVDGARIDGASELMIFCYVTLPGLRPVFAFAVHFRVVALAAVRARLVPHGRGPVLSTNGLNSYVAQQTFTFHALGIGAALTMVLVVLMAIPLIVTSQFAREVAEMLRLGLSR